MDVCLNFVSERFLMRRRTFTAATAAFLVLSFMFSAFAAVDKKRPVKRKVKAQTNPLVALLPASDAVATINGNRFFGEALPKVLSANQKLLGEILAKIDSLETKTGVDLRRFDAFAAGINIVKKESNDFDYDPVVVARGAVDTASLVESARKVAEGRYREETIAGRTVYVISAKDIADQLKKTSAGPNDPIKDVEIKNDIAISALDSTTMVVGNLNRVRETVEHKTSISSELATLLTKKAPAVVNFAGNVPGGMSSLLPLDNDELGATIDSIKTIYGSVDVAAGQGIISLTGRTVQAKQAADLKGTLEGLRDLGKGLLGASKNADKKLYARLLSNIRITQAANEISLDLAMPQADIDALVAIFKK
jgi:hypothetical protein